MNTISIFAHSCHAHDTSIGSGPELWTLVLGFQRLIPIPISAWGYLGQAPSLLLGIVPHVAILEPVPIPHHEWTFIVTHQDPTTSSITYNPWSTIYVVTWMQSHQLDSDSVQHPDHDPDPSFCSPLSCLPVTTGPLPATSYLSLPFPSYSRYPFVLPLPCWLSTTPST